MIGLYDLDALHGKFQLHIRVLDQIDEMRPKRGFV